MKIAITGAQSTGKSTLLKYLKKDTDLQGFEFIEELTRQIAAKGININEE
jgi:dephospho-CoA kinase